MHTVEVFALRLAEFAKGRRFAAQLFAGAHWQT
jgi:hypothetical protein